MDYKPPTGDPANEARGDPRPWGNEKTPCEPVKTCKREKGI